MKRKLRKRQVERLINLGVLTEYKKMDLYELLEIIPCDLPGEVCHFAIMKEDLGLWTAYYEEEKTERFIHGFTRDELIDALYKLICWCARNEYL